MHNAKSLIDDAAQISILMEWIESARNILYVADWVHGTTPEFRELCKKTGIPICGAAWDVEQSDALARLATIQRGMLERVANV